MWKSYNFWVRLVAVAVLLLRIIGAEFGFAVDSDLIINIATAVASVLVVLGVINVPSVTTSSETNSNKNSKKGENFMENFEKIKEDILKAKEKLIADLAGLGDVSGVVSILDQIVGGEEMGVVDDGESSPVGEQAEVVVEAGGGKEPVQPKEVIIDNGDRRAPVLQDADVTDNGENNIIDNQDEIESIEIEGQEEVNAPQEPQNVEIVPENVVEEVVREVVGGDDEDEALRQILKARLKKIIETESEAILSELA